MLFRLILNTKPERINNSHLISILVMFYTVYLINGKNLPSKKKKLVIAMQKQFCQSAITIPY